MSEWFFLHAVGTSAGSLSPRTNWSSLASFEFDLPPLDKQRRIAKMLWAVDESICSNEVCSNCIKGLIQSMRVEQFSHKIVTQRIARCCTKLGSGKTPRGGEKIYVSDGVLFLRSQNIHPEGLRLDDVAYIPIKIDNEMKNTRVEKGDVLLNITGASIGRCTVYDTNAPANVNQHVCILRTKGDLVLPHFLANYLQSRIGQQMIAAFSTKGNREGLNFQQLGSISLFLPPLEDQRLFCERIAQAQQVIDIIHERSNRLRYVFHGILSKLMGGLS
jgi:type I restriction enzyme S subunit